MWSRKSAGKLFQILAPVTAEFRVTPKFSVRSSDSEATGHHKRYVTAICSDNDGGVKTEYKTSLLPLLTALAEEQNA